MKKLLIVVSFLLLTLRVDASDCSKTSVGLVPLMDGPGLYPSGLNKPPDTHLARGQQLAASLLSRQVNVLMSVGMSNTNQKFGQFVRNELTTTDKHPNLVIVNGAGGKEPAEDWANPFDDAYVQADEKLTAAGVTRHDVGVLWVLVTNAANGGFDVWRKKVKDDTRAALETLVAHYPNVSTILLSSRVYGGYEVQNGGLNPEPYAYESGVVMRELIAEHLKGTLLPDRWIAWGPYLWADGLKPRSDGLIWQCSDFQNDGVHPSSTGTAKVASMLSSYLRSDLVAHVWFLLESPAPPGPIPPRPRPGRLP